MPEPKAKGDKRPLIPTEKRGKRGYPKSLEKKLGELCPYSEGLIGIKLRCGMITGCGSCYDMLVEEKKANDKKGICFGHYRSDSSICSTCSKEITCAAHGGNILRVVPKYKYGGGE